MRNKDGYSDRNVADGSDLNASLADLLRSRVGHASCTTVSCHRIAQDAAKSIAFRDGADVKASIDELLSDMFRIRLALLKVKCEVLIYNSNSSVKAYIARGSIVPSVAFQLCAVGSLHASTIHVLPRSLAEARRLTKTGRLEVGLCI